MTLNAGNLSRHFSDATALSSLSLCMVLLSWEAHGSGGPRPASVWALLGGAPGRSGRPERGGASPWRQGRGRPWLPVAHQNSGAPRQSAGWADGGAPSLAVAHHYFGAPRVRV